MFIFFLLGTATVFPYNQKKPWSDLAYDFNRTAYLTDENSLLLPDLTPEDSGIYECQIGAKVGGQNTESVVVLEVPGRQYVLHTPCSG